MKTIVIRDYNKYMASTRVDDFPKPSPTNAFRQGYWNVYEYTEDLENYLKNHEIDHFIKFY